MIPEAGGKSHLGDGGTGIIAPDFFSDFQTGIQQQSFETGLVIAPQKLGNRRHTPPQFPCHIRQADIFGGVFFDIFVDFRTELIALQNRQFPDGDIVDQSFQYAQHTTKFFSGKRG